MGRQEGGAVLEARGLLCTQPGGLGGGARDAEEKGKVLTIPEDAENGN